MQNLVGIDAVVSIIHKCWYLACFAWKCLITPQMEGFWHGFYPLNGQQSHRDPQRHLLVDPPVFAQLTLLPSRRNPILCPVGASALSSNTWFPRSTRVHNQTASRSVRMFLAGRTTVTDRPTDHGRPRYTWHIEWRHIWWSQVTLNIISPIASLLDVIFLLSYEALRDLFIHLYSPNREIATFLLLLACPQRRFTNSIL